MQFHETKLPGVFEIHLEPKNDERGFLARTWCRKEFSDHGLSAKSEQCNISFNSKKGTLCGMHYQAAPDAEVKLIRCTRGAVYDVLLDLRPQSKTLKEWIGFNLTPTSQNMTYVPEGCARISDPGTNNEVSYRMSQFYNAESARGVRWDDPAFNINWPEKVRVISERDRTYPNFG